MKQNLLQSNFLYRTWDGFSHTIRFAFRMDHPGREEAFRSAVQKSAERYPYFCIRVEREGEAYRFLPNEAPIPVRFGEKPVQLTKKEFDLLLYLMTHRGKAVTRDELLENSWGYEYTGDTNVVDVYVRYLRHKIEDRFGVRMIQTIRSVGYMFSDE